MKEDILPKRYMAAAYLRLSKEDGNGAGVVDKKESNSIANQKALIYRVLEKYQDVTLYDVYVDDGFTGLNFERPEFRRMEQDIVDGKVNMILVKDLSRLGRDYIEVGRYLKIFFPFYHVRFISILDHYDSLTASQMENHIMIPIKTFINDSYSRDLSEKVRSHQKIMREEGLYIGSFVPYGYKKMEEDKNKIVLDSYAGGVVKKIFLWTLDGMSARTIAEKLNQLGIDSPAEYKKQSGSAYQCVFQKNMRALWSGKAVLRILRNPLYTGVLIQGKTEKINYKLKQMVQKPEEEWSIKKNHHEPIIPMSEFLQVDRILSASTGRRYEKENLFSGILCCESCGKAMVRRKNTYKEKGKVYYICSQYNKGNGCSRHSIEEDALKNILLQAINIELKNLPQMKQEIELLDCMEENIQDVIVNEEAIELKNNALIKCHKMYQALQDDVANGVISEKEGERFKKIYFEREKQLEKEIQFVKREITESNKRKKEKKNYFRQILQGKRIENLNKWIIHWIVQKIVVKEGREIEIIFFFQKHANREIE